MIDSDWAQPTAERSTRKRPETTDTPAPASRHRAMVTRTTSGRRVATRRPAMGSALSALTFDRTPTQVDGRQSCWAHTHRSSSSPTVRKGAARRMDRYSANWAASSRRRSSASSRAPWNQNDRWTVRPDTGSTPTAMRISNTPGRFSRNDPSPQAPIGPKIGSEVGSPVDPYFCRPPVPGP
jgi:hypothetical protein